MKKWQKVDLHLHTFKTTRDQTRTIVENNVEDFIDKIKENGIKLIAITNHNYFDLKQYKMIKEKSKNLFEVLPGVEADASWQDNDGKDFKFQFNLIFDDEFIDKNAETINKKLSELNIKERDNTFQKKYLSKPDFFELITNLKGRIILCLDYAKSQSNILKESSKKPDSFWFHFDIYEGNHKASIDIVNENIENFISKWNSNEKINIPLIFGTDNKDYTDYPNNGERKGWTGTFLYSEPIFNGLLVAIDFPQFITKKEEKLDDAPIMADPEILSFIYEYEKSGYKQNIQLDRGVNVILGRRGSGKTKLLNEIVKISKRHGLGDSVFKLNQNIVSNIIEKSLSGNSIFKGKNEKEEELEEIFKNFKNRNYENFNFNNENDKILKIDLNSLFNSFYELISVEKNNMEISKEEELLNEINNVFTEFSKSPTISGEIIKVNEFITDNFDNEFLKLIFKSIDIMELEKSVIKIKNEEMKNIKISFQKDELLKKNISSAQNKLRIELENINASLNKNIKTYKKTLDNILEISESISREYEFENVDIHDLKISLKLKREELEYEKILNEIGKYNKVRDLIAWVDDFSKNFFWVDSKIDLMQNKIKAYCEENNFKFMRTFHGKDVSKLSPGQLAEEYIGNIFLDNNYKMIIIDQPEDQLDAETVSEKIIEPIKEKYSKYMYAGAQIIFVTHDPKIAINLGPTIIIKCEEESNSKYTKKIIKLSDIYARESVIANKVDGKKEYVHTRSKIYGKTN